MAEAMWRHRLPDAADYHVSSAGIGALIDCPAEEHAVTVMREWGLDLSAHRARQLDLELACDYDLILVMDNLQRQWIGKRIRVLRGRVYLLGHWSDGEIADPFRGSEQDFRTARDRIDRATDAWLQWLRP